MFLFLRSLRAYWITKLFILRLFIYLSNNIFWFFLLFKLLFFINDFLEVYFSFGVQTEAANEFVEVVTALHELFLEVVFLQSQLHHSATLRHFDAEDEAILRNSSDRNQKIISFFAEHFDIAVFVRLRIRQFTFVGTQPPFFVRKLSNEFQVAQILLSVLSELHVLDCGFLGCDPAFHFWILTKVHSFSILSFFCSFCNLEFVPSQLTVRVFSGASLGFSRIISAILSDWVCTCWRFWCSAFRSPNSSLRSVTRTLVEGGTAPQCFRSALFVPRRVHRQMSLLSDFAQSLAMPLVAQFVHLVLHHSVGHWDFSVHYIYYFIMSFALTVRLL